MLEAILTYDQFTPPIEYRTGVDSNDSRVRKHIERIERVPDQLQKIIADQWGYIAFFNGSITDQPEFRREKGRVAGGYNRTTWDVLPGGYYQSKHAVLIGVDGDYIPIDLELALHEYGHSFNDEIGRFFFGESLSETPIVLDAIQKRPFNFNPWNDPHEFVAHSVELFYSCRYEFELQQPEVHEFLRELEMKSLNPDEFRHQSSVRR